MFKQRLGFSGTPSDMLPLEFQKCQYETGADARMIDFLTRPDVVQYIDVQKDWSVGLLLDLVARGPFHALIDAGALITGLSNLEVSNQQQKQREQNISQILSVLSLKEVPTRDDSHILILPPEPWWQVASELLTRGLNEMDGVVFLDELDRKMVLLRYGRQVCAS